MNLSHKKQYEKLENEVLQKLKELINKSKYTSKAYGIKAIQVNVFDYVELIVLNETLTFIDDDGLQYSLFADANLEDLIDIINS